jgi:hypothetical protein
MCCVYTQNEVNVDLEISLYNDDKAEKSHLLYVTLQVENIVGKKQKVRKERMRERGNRVRGSVRLRKASVINLTIGQILWSLETTNPLKQKYYK